MSASIQVLGLASTDPVPGRYIQTSFAQGQNSVGGAAYEALIIATKTTAGTATADTVIYGPLSSPPLATEDDAIALFGAGSPAHRMWRQFVKVNKTTPLSVICVAESAGVAATGTITFATTAAASGVTRVYVGENYIERSIASGDTPTVTAAAVVALINAQTAWPVTANNVAGVVTLTWKTKGPQGNWGRYSATITSGIGTTVTPSAQTFMSGGTTAQSYTTALATINPFRKYYIIPEESPVSGASSNLSAVGSQVSNDALPITGLRQRWFVGSVDTLANNVTFATAQNHIRGEIITLPQCDRPPEEIAAFTAGIYALEEQGDNFRCNFSGYGNDADTSALWDIKAPLSGAAPTRSDFLSALSNGVTPIGCNSNGSTYLVKRVTMRSLNGAVSDYRIRDPHKVTILDKLADAWDAKQAALFTGKKIGDDPVPGARTPGPDVLTPSIYRAAFVKLAAEFVDRDQLEHLDTVTIPGLQVQRETSPTTRIALRAPLDTIDIADQLVSVLAQVG